MRKSSVDANPLDGYDIVFGAIIALREQREEFFLQPRVVAPFDDAYYNEEVIDLLRSQFGVMRRAEKAEKRAKRLAAEERRAAKRLAALPASAKA